MRRAVLMAVVLVSLASCGSEGRPATPSPSSPDRATPGASTDGGTIDRSTFVRTINDACREYAEADEALEYPEERDEYVPFMRAFIANSAALDSKLAALRPPAGIEHFDGYVADNRKQTDILQAALPKVQAAVGDSDLTEADVVIDRTIDEFNAVVEELDPYARRYGFTECLSGLDA